MQLVLERGEVVVRELEELGDIEGGGLGEMVGLLEVEEGGVEPGFAGAGGKGVGLQDVFEVRAEAGLGLAFGLFGGCAWDEDLDEEGGWRGSGAELGCGELVVRRGEFAEGFGGVA